ncbi:MAG: NUDIX domain-containing protein [Pseudonocardia sediminis]
MTRAGAVETGTDRRPEPPPAAGRREYFHDPAAPAATAVVPLVYAVLRDDAGRVLLVRRCDTGDWELPGGRVDPGESASDALVREVAEESGLLVVPVSVAGVHSDPGHVVDGGPARGVYQPFAVCLRAEVVGGDPHGDDRETSAARWWTEPELLELRMQPAVRRRLTDALGGRVRTRLA